MKKVFLLSCFGLAIAVFSCNQSGTKNKDKTTNEANKDQDSMLTLAHMFFKPLPVTAENANNPLTDEKVQLGKILFYDTRLSKSGSISCNSCHNLASFGVDNQPTSTGEKGQKGTRNSPTVFNAALHNMNCEKNQINFKV